MLRWIVTTACAALITQAADPPQPETQPAGTQPATAPTESRAVLRRPVQAEVLRSLLRQREQPKPVLPEQGPRGAKEGLGPDGQPLLLEGTVLVERPGRLVHEDGQARFLFHADGDSPSPRSMRILQSQLLETMEREAQDGFSEFIISGEVTRYRGENFLLLRKVLRRTGHGNLTP